MWAALLHNEAGQHRGGEKRVTMHLCCLCREIVCSNVLAHAQKVIIVLELRFSPYFLSLAVARFADESSIFLHKSATRFIYEVHCLRRATKIRTRTSPTGQ